MPEQLARYTVTLRDGRQVYKDLPASWDKAQVRAAFAQDMAAEGIDSRAQMVLDGPQGHSASSYEPSLKEKAASLASMAFAPVAVDQHHANRIGGRLADLLDWSPVGAAFGIDEGAGELGRGLRNGDVAAGVSGLAMMALSGVPEARQGAKGIRGLLANEDGVIRAWHGSPHDFDKFSLSKIGTGEGAQAYGHGLYFAEARGVAEDYRDTLGATAGRVVTRTPQGQVRRLSAPLHLERIRKKWGDDLATEVDETIRLAGRGEMSVEELKSYWRAEAARNEFGRDVHTRLFRDAEGIENGGRLYEVNINAEPEDFLDWDAPLSGQARGGSFLGDELRRYLGPSYDRQIPNFEPMPAGDLLGHTRGRSLGALSLAQDARQAGIPGIRYLDQGSRGAGDGTRNYVVFDDSLIDILNKY